MVVLNKKESLGQRWREGLLSWALLPENHDYDPCVSLYLQPVTPGFRNVESLHYVG